MTLCSLVVRTAVVYERPATKFQQLMIEAGNCFDPMHKVNRADALQKLEQLLREFWIQDGRFVDRFALRPLFGLGVHMRRLRYYLQELETFYSAKGSSDLRFNSDNSSIDHVMPDTLSEIWRRDLAEKNPDQLHLQHESLGDTIGNLTVVSVPDNAKIKNLPFAEKKQVYLNPEEALPKLGFRRRHPLPACELNQYFRNHENWGFADILERGRALAIVAASIWKVGIRFPREIDLSRLPRTGGKPGVPDHVRGLKKDGPFAGQNRESEIKKWEENQRERERFAAALPEIAKRNDVTGELQILGIGKLKVQVRVVKGRALRLVCEALL